MKTAKATILALAVASVTLLGVEFAALAQSFRWTDDAGNIYFTDSVQKVPKRYRNQVVPPTPTVFMTREMAFRQQQDSRRKEMELRRQDMEKKRDQQRKQVEFERDLERRRRDDERQRKFDEAKRQEEALRRADKEVSDTAE